MFKSIYLSFFLIIFCNTVFAAPESSEVVDKIMRGLGIKYIISTDRKLPKKDRQKWEQSLSEYVDFESLNGGMMGRIREALNELNEEKRKVSPKEQAVFEKLSISMGKKAVLFLVPKELTRYTLTYLRKKDEQGIVVKCSNILKSEPDQESVLCIKDVSESEIHLNFIIVNVPNVNIHLVFKRTNKWLLSGIEEPISEKMLEMIGRWK